MNILLKIVLLVLFTLILSDSNLFAENFNRSIRTPPSLSIKKKVNNELVKGKKLSLKRYTQFYSRIGRRLRLNRTEMTQFLRILLSNKKRTLDLNLQELKKRAFSRRPFNINPRNHRSSGPHPKLMISKLKKLLKRDRFEKFLKLEKTLNLGSTRFNNSILHDNWSYYGTLRITKDTTLTRNVFGQVIVDADNITLTCQNNVIADVGQASNCGTNNNRSCGIKVLGRSNVKIKGCHVYQFEYGIWISQSDNIEVDKCYASGNEIGLRVENSQYTKVLFSAAIDNTEEGFVVRDAQGTFFQHNSSVRNGRDGFDENDGSAPYYLRNDSVNNGLNGFELDFSSNAIYWENKVYTNGQHGISLDAVVGGKIRGNIIIGSGEDGLRLDDENNQGTVNFEVKYNESSGNGRRSAHQCGSICTGNIFIENKFFGPTNNI